jgi:hypothetical protein
MAAAVSFGFGKDLRPDFRSLNFPISELIYNELYNSVTGVSEEKAIGKPAAFTLKQNYPNPFNPTTVISYSVPSSTGRDLAAGGQVSVNGHVKLCIFDMFGRKVATLVDEKESAGSYAVQWNASSLPSGIYFCRLQIGHFSESKKLILLK